MFVIVMEFWEVSVPRGGLNGVGFGEREDRGVFWWIFVWPFSGIWGGLGSERWLKWCRIWVEGGLPWCEGAFLFVIVVEFGEVSIPRGG